METSKLKLSLIVYTPYSHFVTWCHAHLHVTEIKCSKFHLFRWLGRSFEPQDFSNNSTPDRLSVDSSIYSPTPNFISVILNQNMTVFRTLKKDQSTNEGCVAQWGGHLTRNLSVVSSNIIKGSCWTLLLYLSTGWIRELIPAWFHNQT